MIYYHNYPVFPYEIKPLNSILLGHTHKRNFIGKKWQKEIYFFIEHPKIRLNLTFGFDNYEEMKKIRDFFFMTQGRAKLFWLPTWDNSITPLLDISSGDTEIIIPYSLFETFQKSKKVITLYFPDYDFITYVLEATQEYNDTLMEFVNVLRLKDPIPFDYKIKDNCSPIQFLILGRWATDEISFKFIDLVRGETSLNFNELAIADYKRFVSDIYGDIYGAD